MQIRNMPLHGISWESGICVCSKYNVFAFIELSVCSSQSNMCFNENRAFSLSLASFKYLFIVATSILFFTCQKLLFFYLHA